MSKFVVGNTYSSNKYGDYVILKRISSDRYKIQFLKTGYTNDYCYSTLAYGNVRDPYYPILFGVACLGNVHVKDHQREVNMWRAMIYRCYDKKSKCFPSYGGAGVYVCDRWLVFENYLKDLPFIQGYNKEAFENHEIVLDKDMKYMGECNKCYSPETCIFIKQSDNFSEMLTRRKRTTSSRYVGVTKLYDGKWQATVSHHSKNIYVGRYVTEKEAHEAYLKKKKELSSEEDNNGIS